MSYIPSLHKQAWLLAPSIEDMIPADHICYLVEALIATIDFTGFDERYAGPGHPAYHPRVILKLLVMGVLDKIRSSRKLARNARENVVYMYLAEKLAPDFRTISDFRKQNEDLVKQLFKHTVTLAKQEGMLDLTQLATDGTKIKANAANKRSLTKEELEFMTRFVDEELDEWAKQDQIEDEAFGSLRGHDQLPGKSKKKVQAVVRRYVNKTKEKGDAFKEDASRKLEKARQEMEQHDLNKVSTTDTDCRFMKSKKGKIEFSYNPQVTTDGDGFIIASDVSQDVTDSKQLKPQVLQTEENLGQLPEGTSWNFDNGYFGGENLAFLKQKGIDAYIATEKPDPNPYSADKFIHDPKKNEYTCPAGHVLRFLSERYEKKTARWFSIYKSDNCHTCPHQRSCTKNRTGVRYLKIRPHPELRDEMIAKMRTKKAQETYSSRAKTVEPAIGCIKHNLGVRDFLTRGLRTVRTEFTLACTALNIRKLWLRTRERAAGVVGRVPSHAVLASAHSC
ncbi:MAG: IS1182 family transposase [Methanopyri archaeon]|jgi:transposase|nr:IS1182 family transposase [Methanopyri archaeon]